MITGDIKGQIDRICMGIIKEMPIPLAPVKLQEKFDERLKAVASIKAEQRRLHAGLEILFASLQHRAFRGEL